MDVKCFNRETKLSVADIVIPIFCILLFIFHLVDRYLVFTSNIEIKSPQVPEVEP